MNSASVWMSSLVVAAAGGWFAATIFAAPATSKEPRFPQLAMEQLNEAQKPLGEQIMKVSSVGLGGPYNPMIRSPVLGQRLYDLFYYLRWQTSVPVKLNEFAILVIGRQWRSQVEWFAHAPLAAKAGLSTDIIAELKAGKRPSNMAEDEALVYDFVTDTPAGSVPTIEWITTDAGQIRTSRLIFHKEHWPAAVAELTRRAPVAT